MTDSVSNHVTNPTLNHNELVDTQQTITSVSVVIPIYNEIESLPALISRTTEACSTLKQAYEIIFIDDGSHDGSTEMLIDAANADSHIVAICLNRNYGQHSAILAGFKHAAGDLIITLDGDLQNPPEEIPKLVNVAEEGYDVVGTIRANRQDSWFRKRASKMINSFIQHTTGKTIGDYGCMLRAYRRSIVLAMLDCHERSTFIPILANSFAHKTIDIPVKHAEREFGESKYSVLKLVHLMFDLVTCLSTSPLRLLSIFGGITAFTGFLFAFLLIILRMVYGSHWAASGVFTLFAVLFIFIGLQFIGMGILGEYIGRIYNDVRARPRYFIRSITSTNPNISKSSSSDNESKQQNSPFANGKLSNSELANSQLSNDQLSNDKFL